MDHAIIYYNLFIFELLKRGFLVVDKNWNQNLKKECESFNGNFML